MLKQIEIKSRFDEAQTPAIMTSPIAVIASIWQIKRSYKNSCPASLQREQRSLLQPNVTDEETAKQSMEIAMAHTLRVYRTKFFD